MAKSKFIAPRDVVIKLRRARYDTRMVADKPNQSKNTVSDDIPVPQETSQLFSVFRSWEFGDCFNLV